MSNTAQNQIPPDAELQIGVEQGMSTRRSNERTLGEDWSKKICEISRPDADFFALAHQGKEEPTISETFNWTEFEVKPAIVQLPTLAAGNFNAGQSAMIIPESIQLLGLVRDHVVTADKVNYFRVLENPVKSGGSWTIKLVKLGNRNLGGFFTTEERIVQTDVTGMSGQKLHMLYPSKPEASSDINPVKYYLDDTSNTITTIEASTQISWLRAARGSKFGLDEREWQNNLVAKEYLRMWERAFIAGAPFDNGSDRLGTKGLLNFNIQRTIGNYDAFGYFDFVDHMEDKVKEYNYDTDEFTGFVNNHMLNWLIRMAAANPKGYFGLDIQGKVNKYGMRIRELVTPFGNVTVRPNRFLTEYFGKEPVMIICDMSKIKTRYLTNKKGESLATRHMKGVEPNSAKFYQDTIYGAYGLQVENAKCHSILHLSHKPTA